MDHPVLGIIIIDFGTIQLYLGKFPGPVQIAGFSDKLAYDDDIRSMLLLYADQIWLSDARILQNANWKVDFNKKRPIFRSVYKSWLQFDQSCSLQFVPECG